MSIIAIPQTDYIFDSWTENGSQVSTDANYSFIVSSDRNLVANFITTVTYTVSVEANPSNGGLTSGEGVYTGGENCNLIAITQVGYEFANWTEAGIIISKDANYSFVVIKDLNVVANFETSSITESTQLKISLYPNPTTGKLQLETDIIGDYNIEITNIAGQIVYSEELKTTEAVINISDKQAGIYFVKISTEDKQSVMKVVKH